MTAPRCTRMPSGPAANAAAQSAAILPRLVTERLHLRAPDLSDLPLWTELCAGKDGIHIGGPLNEEEAWQAFCVYAAGWLLHGHGLWTIDRRQDGARLGFVMLGLEWGDEEPELGWMLAPEARGHGYGTEAASAARDHGMALFGPGGCVSYIDPSNPASSRLAARIGAKRDTDAESRFDDKVEIWRHGVAA